ncbi:MAG: FCD domain-containing protein [Pseudomonadota bacterium]
MSERKSGQFHADSRPRSATSLYQTILSQIFEGTLTPGTRLPTELELVGIYGVSRAIVRSALQRLKSDKLVVSRQGAGNYVAGLTHAGEYVFEKLDEADEAHVLEIRKELERTATWYAASNADQVDISRLNAIHQEFEQAANQVDVDLILLRRLDIEFHLTIARASSNPVLSDLINMLSVSSASTWLKHRPFSPELRRRLAQSSLREHDLILKAINLRNQELASQAMHKHVQTVDERILKLADAAPTEPPKSGGDDNVSAIEPSEQEPDQHAYRDLLNGILSGAIPGGGRLPREQDLASQYKISRPAIRKVLQALKDDYLVHSRQGSAHYVTGFSTLDPPVLRIPEDTAFAAVFEVRMLLECLACEHAAIHADEGVLQKLATAQSGIAAIIRTDHVDLLNGRRADIDFHATIASCSPNPLLRGLIDFLMPSLAPNFSRWSALSFEQKTELAHSSIQDHDIIISAIRAREPSLARLAMQQHFERTTRKYRAFVWVND